MYVKRISGHKSNIRMTCKYFGFQIISKIFGQIQKKTRKHWFNIPKKTNIHHSNSQNPKIWTNNISIFKINKLPQTERQFSELNEPCAIFWATICLFFHNFFNAKFHKKNTKLISQSKYERFWRHLIYLQNYLFFIWSIVLKNFPVRSIFESSTANNL